MSLEVVLATHNEHKVAEFQRILGAGMPHLTVLGYDGPEPVEDGTSFAENALIKARTAAEHTGSIALADDSGICVDVMGGAPGIFSARWAGKHGDSSANLQLLLEQMRDIPDPHRGARFQCTIALVVPAGSARAAGEHVVEGIWPGALAREARGDLGFGYDPIFIPAGEARTSAELSVDEKNATSHRARAFTRLLPLLQEL